MHYIHLLYAEDIIEQDLSLLQKTFIVIEIMVRTLYVYDYDEENK